MIIKVSDYIANFLVEKRIKYIYEMVGGMSAYLSNSFYNNNKLIVIPMKHEQSASFACIGYGSIMNKPVISMGISGPGAINMIGGIASSYYDSIPAFFISGQVNDNELKKNKNIRQLGFQEHNIVDMVKGICKRAVTVNFKEEIPYLLEDLYSLTIHKRYGPVLLDIPMNIQRDTIDTDIAINNSLIKTNTFHLDNFIIDEIIRLINESNRPIILAGGGVRKSGSIVLFKKIVEKLRIPVVTSLIGIDSLPTQSDLMFGLLGTYGHRSTNNAIFNCDLLIVFGSRLDIRQTGKNIDSFIANKKIIRIDVDKYELNNNIKIDYNIEADLATFFKKFYKKIIQVKVKNFEKWIYDIRVNKIETPIEKEQDCNGINPHIILKKISKYSDVKKSYVTDIGLNQIWAAQSLILHKNDRFITSGGYASMGFALPASIGIYHATKSLVFVITGDGGIQCNIQELETISKLSIPIKIIILNNRSLGLIRQFQDENFNSYYASSVIGYSSPDFVEIAKAYKIKSDKICSYDDLNDNILYNLYNKTEPYLLDILIDNKYNALPKIIFGKNINEMFPYNK